MRCSRASLLAAFAVTGALTLGACAPRYTWVNELDAPGYCAGSLPPASVAEPRTPAAPAVPTAAPGRSGAVSGRVERQDDGAPLGWASVDLRPLGAAADPRPAAVTTDSTGVFAFGDLPPGRYAPPRVRRAGGYAHRGGGPRRRPPRAPGSARSRRRVQRPDDGAGAHAVVARLVSGPAGRSARPPANVALEPTSASW